MGGTWATHALAAVKGAGYKDGGARRAVVELLAGENCCVTAQEIFDRLREERRPVGIASVYRVLDLLAELKLIQRVDVGGGPARFEASRVETHHHHLVCDDCGKVEAFSDEPLERAIRGAAGRVGYVVGAHDVVLRGACGDCRSPVSA